MKLLFFEAFLRFIAMEKSMVEAQWSEVLEIKGLSGTHELDKVTGKGDGINGRSRVGKLNRREW